MATSTEASDGVSLRRQGTRAPVIQAGSNLSSRLPIRALFMIDLSMAVLAASMFWLFRAEIVQAASLNSHIVASVVLVPIILVLMHVAGLYDSDRILRGTREYGAIGRAGTLAVLVVLGLSHAQNGTSTIGRTWFLTTLISTFLFVAAGRFAFRRVIRRLRHRGRFQTRVCIVGASAHGVAIGEQLASSVDDGVELVGFLDEYLPLGSQVVGDTKVIGRPSDLYERGRGVVADEFILVPQALPHQRLDELSRLMVSRHGPKVRMAVSTTDLLSSGALVAQRAGVPLVTLGRPHIVGFDALMKRSLDIVGAFIGLAIVGPPALVALVRARQRGVDAPYTATRILGRDGGPIELRLLRSSVTSWGALRGAPALLAVLRGDLSLVGPRPVEISDPREIPISSLAAVKPGLTGPWRLVGRGASLVDQAVGDLTYVRNYEIWEDLRIIAATIGVPGTREAHPSIARWHEHAHDKQSAI